MSATPARAVRNWQDAEAVAAAWVRWLGHPDARQTPPGADGGVDVVSATALGQVKWKSKAVGRPDVQQLLGAAAGVGRTLFFFSRTGYTQQALTYADGVGIACFSLMPDGTIRASNSVAAAGYGNAHRRHQAEGGWTDPAVTAAMQQQVFKWAGGTLLVILVVVGALWDDHGAGPWLILPALAALLTVVGAIWVLYVVVHDIPSKYAAKAQAPSPPQAVASRAVTTPKSHPTSRPRPPDHQSQPALPAVTGGPRFLNLDEPPHFTKEDAAVMRANGAGFRVAGVADNILYEIMVTGRADHPVIGSKCIRSLVAQHIGETIVAGPNGPTFKIDPTDAGSVLFLLMRKTRVQHVGEGAPNLFDR